MKQSKKAKLGLFGKTLKLLLRMMNNRSNRPEVFCKKGVLRNFAKFTGKHLCQSLFFNRPTALLKKRLWHRCFPMNFAKFLTALLFHRTPLVAASGVFRRLGVSKKRSPVKISLLMLQL